jgi:hypothetical protein
VRRKTAFSPAAGKEIPVVDITPKGRPIKARQREATAYVQVSLKLAAECAKATRTQASFVWLILKYTAWRTGKMTFPLANGEFERHGISRDVKREALEKLEAAELISVKRNGQRSPVVTLRGKLWRQP